MRRIDHDGAGSLEIRFPYRPDLVERVKALAGRRWQPERKIWRVPDDQVVEVVDAFVPEGFACDDATCVLYRERGGTRALSGAPPAAAAAPLPGLFDDPALDPPNPDDWTVATLNRRVSEVLATAFPQAIWLVGEISGFAKNRHRRVVGFQLIERSADGAEVASVHAVLFEDSRRAIQTALAAAGNPFALDDEITVRVRGRVELYPAWGQYRVRIEDLDVAYTLGEAARRRDEIVRRLTQEGLADRNPSLPLPDVPLAVGLITSLGSDAYNDVLRTLSESGFAFRVHVHGARVQGRHTEASVLNALDWFRERAADFDVVLICRGGGSRTDLAWFDSEALGRAVASFPLPVIVGIGHEQDFSVLDFVARRAKTPTAAAAVLVDAARDALDRVERTGADVVSGAATTIRDEQRRARERERSLSRAGRFLLQRERDGLGHRRARIVLAARTALAAGRRELTAALREIPRAATTLIAARGATLETEVRQMIQGARRDTAEAARRITVAAAALAPRAGRVVERAAERLDARARRLDLVDPRRVIERGYAVLRADDGRVVRRVAEAPAGSRVVAELSDGRIALRSEGHHPSGDRHE